VPEQSARGSRFVVGLISGTSMDGIDAALVRITGPATQPRVRLLAFLTIPYPDWLRQRVLAIAGGESTTAEEINQLHTLLGAAFGEAALKVCRRGRVNPSRLFAIGSHGQTIHHFGGLKLTREFRAATRKLSAKLRAGKRGAYEIGLDPIHIPELMKTLEKGTPVQPELWSVARPCTLQIAEPALIAERTGAPVVADFRPADMAAGGQGAPLVPMVDYLLLRDAHKGTVALNVGGIANFTVIPAGAKPEQVFGFDTGPGNMIIDGLVRHFTKGQKAYDAGGCWAARGRVLDSLLDEVLRLPFFAQQPPKSAGREQFGQHFIQQFFLKRRGARPEDLLRTATELTARTIADALERFVLGKIAIHRLIISGGGAHNRLLVARLAELPPSLRVHRSDEFGLDVDAKEAIAFAVLADRTMHGLPGNLPAVTGARRSVVLGKMSRP
jgi:anhydro-N-acetylmuramic acid kinase